jgi:hypothetical protein
MGHPPFLYPWDLRPVWGWLMAGILLALLGRLWIILLSFFSRSEPPSSMLPVSVRPSENSTEGSTGGEGRESFVHTGISFQT